MIKPKRVVLDTNAVVSGALFPGSVPEQALLKAQTAIVLATVAMRSEVIEVLARSKFLEAAVDGRADAILTGDLDLPALGPFHGISILTPAAFLDRQSD